MRTDLPAGSIIQMRHRGEDALYEVTTFPEDRGFGDKGYTGVSRHLKRGDRIHKVTWARGEHSTLNVKGTYELTQDAEWLPTYERLEDTTPERFLAERNMGKAFVQMFGTMGEDFDALASVFDGIGMTGIVVDGHDVIISPDTVSVRTGGASWTWMTPDRQPDGTYHHVGPAAEELKTWGFEQYRDYAANVVLPEYHTQNERAAERGWFQCAVCHPPYHNVLVPKSLKKVKA